MTNMHAGSKTATCAGGTWSLSEDGKVDMHGYIYASSTTSITYCTPADQIVKLRSVNTQ
jgi:hypothetical protein